MVILLFLFVPVLPAIVVEYAACRFPKRRLWRWVPPAGTAVVTAVVTLSRYHGWSAGAEKAPWETLLFIPGLPSLGVFLGLWLGWRLWGRLWLPRVVNEKKGR